MFKNDEDLIENSLNKDIDDFLQVELSLLMGERKLTKENQASVENIPKVFENSEPDEFGVNFPPATENDPVLKSKNDHNESISISCYNELQTQLENARSRNLRDRNEIVRLHNQIESQSAFCLNIGAVLGILIWRASEEPEVINRFLSEQSCQNSGGQFVSIADRIIVNFFKTYQEVLPPSKTDEYQFAMGLLGTITNISSRPEGRQFLIDNQNGKNLVKNLVLYLPKVPTDSGSPLKRLVMSILWNMSVNKDGLSYLYELEIGRVVAHCLDEPSSERLQLLGLQLLHSITYKETNPRRADLLEHVSIDKIHRIAHTRRREKIGDLALQLFNYFINAEHFTAQSSKHQQRNK